ncbi:MAG TPA: permease [Acidimicrobiales bacterium]|nr:permease [Acidimicrobiales bacterium]
MTSLGVVPVLHWVGLGLREGAAMVWMTFWPLVLGFSLSGLVQSFLPRDGLRAQLGTTTPGAVVKASLLGVISSSCSYAASAMSRALFARGASWTNALIFMIASTNLVIELGVVLYLLLGWQFVAAQIIGGIIMVIGLSLLTTFAFSRSAQRQLRERVLQDAPPPSRPSSTSWRQRLRARRNYQLAARFTLGDFTMLRKELFAGFLVAGFLAVDVPAVWWTHVFITGHGWITVVENAVIAPLIAVVSFVCSVGNIPLAAALWSHGVAFGGVISFIFADLVTLPLLLIYRRFYGTGMAGRLFLLMWFVMSAGGIVVDVVFHAANLIPTSTRPPALRGQFPLGWTLILNLVAVGVLVALWTLAHSHVEADTTSARDPICGMTVDISAPVAVRHRDGTDYYFCSHRCAERFDRGESEITMENIMNEDELGDRVDPICGMRVNSANAISTVDENAITHYFCSEGCLVKFLEHHSESDTNAHPVSEGEQVDPICGMRVNSATAISMVGEDAQKHYFCSEACLVKFLEHRSASRAPAMNEDLGGDQVDPICGMRVNSANAITAQGPDGTAYYFCSEGCRRAFLEHQGPGTGEPRVELGRKPLHE